MLVLDQNSSTETDLHLATAAYTSYKLANAPISLYPFPHFYLENVFPADFYKKLIENFPDLAMMVPIAQARSISGYEQRWVMPLEQKFMTQLPAKQCQFWSDVSQWLLSHSFINLLLRKFASQIKARFADQPNVKFYYDSNLVLDLTQYSIGPHTDSARKVISLLFYLPTDHSQVHLGTSIYTPKQADFTCNGEQHYDFANFTKLYTMPFLPNSVFGFLRGAQSFHGVEPIKDANCKRPVLLLNAYWQDAT